MPMNLGRHSDLLDSCSSFNCGLKGTSSSLHAILRPLFLGRKVQTVLRPGRCLQAFRNATTTLYESFSAYVLACLLGNNQGLTNSSLSNTCRLHPDLADFHERFEPAEGCSGCCNGDEDHPDAPLNKHVRDLEVFEGYAIRTREDDQRIDWQREKMRGRLFYDHNGLLQVEPSCLCIFAFGDCEFGIGSGVLFVTEIGSGSKEALSNMGKDARPQESLASGKGAWATVLTNKPVCFIRSIVCYA